jgi:dolichol-phosphate mannosyltransferase
MTRLSFVIPCYNEREGIPKLLLALEETRLALGPEYQLELVLVDDGSTDGTGEALQAATNPRDVPTRLIQHARNQGLGAALRTGFAHASGDLVATADSDCTYDPRELVNMVRLLTPAVDVVVASPYHPKGGVRNVPGYRLLLSRNLSRLYNWVTGADLYTYTGLFRLYRAQVIRTVTFESDGFLSMAQIIVGAFLGGFRIVEYPTCLTVREYGESKAMIARLIGDHLRFIYRLVRQRRVPSVTRPSERPVEHVPLDLADAPATPIVHSRAEK